MKAAVNFAKLFLDDLLDRGAKAKASAAATEDLLATVWVVATNGSSVMDSAKKLATQLLHLPAESLASVCVSVVALWSCLQIVRAKGAIKRATPIIDSEAGFELQYAYKQPVRLLAKIGLLASLLVFTVSSVASVNELWPLPTTIYGSVGGVRASSGKAEPIVGAHVRVVFEGVDVTQGSPFPTDMYGYYRVMTSRRVRRSAQIHIHCPNGSMHVFTLSRDYEVPSRELRGADSPELKPFFRHVIDCGGGD
jgi:hypothetical protein